MKRRRGGPPALNSHPRGRGTAKKHAKGGNSGDTFRGLNFDVDYHTRKMLDLCREFEKQGIPQDEAVRLLDEYLRDAGWPDDPPAQHLVHAKSFATGQGSKKPGSKQASAKYLNSTYAPEFWGLLHFECARWPGRDDK